MQECVLLARLPILCNWYNSLMNIISLFSSRSTLLQAFWEGNIPFEIGDICFVFVIFYNLDTRFSQNVENQVASPLFNFWEPVCNDYSRNTRCILLPRLLIYDFPPIICIFSYAIMKVVSLFRSSNSLGVLREVNMPFEIRHIWGTWKQTYVWKKYIFPADLRLYELWEDR